MNPETNALIGEEIQMLQKIIDVVVEFCIQYSFQIVGALIILIIGLKLSGWLSRLMLRVCEKRNVDITLAKFLASSVPGSSYILSSILCLENLSTPFHTPGTLCHTPAAPGSMPQRRKRFSPQTVHRDCLRDRA